MPTERILSWAAAAIGAGATVVDVRPLHGDEAPWLLAIAHAGGTTAAVLREPTSRIWSPMIATGAAALEAAERYGLAAPRLMSADLPGEEAGAVATLETVVPGSTAWPRPSSSERLRAAGAALARVHRIAMAPTQPLPLRSRPIAVDDFAADRRRGGMPTSPLLEAADDVVTAHGLPANRTVLVHGDPWPGNILWTGDEVAALIDWKTAGVGAPGVDLGELRKQAALTFGPEAPDAVLDGWERAAGTKAEDVAYWDAVAALNTRTDLDPLDGVGATERRDAFLRAALVHLGG